MMIFVLLIIFDGIGVDMDLVLKFGVLDNFAQIFVKLAVFLV
jgi:hypothetical protein